MHIILSEPQGRRGQLPETLQAAGRGQGDGREQEMSFGRTQTWVPILALSLTHRGSQQTTEFQLYSKDEGSSTAQTG